MQITRMDLDMTGSPTGLVAKILAAEPDLPLAMPIEELAAALDIIEITELESDGYEGGLLTQPERTEGIILVNKNSNEQRKRFTISHELGHFLMRSHQPIIPGKFMCSREDMGRADLKAQDQYLKMEAEANQFAALLLVPPPKLRTVMKGFSDPDVADILVIAEQYNVSKEMAARTYVDHHGEALAVIITKDDNIIRSYKGKEFPFLTIERNKRAPTRRRLTPDASSLAEMGESNLGAWVNDTGVKIYEQVFNQENGYALILLWAELPDEEADADENKTSAQRYRDRMDRFGGR